ncbi:TetR family transcriptional regulator C-terminal domain-containing protein [Nisaea sp.]|uniref:TetR family transcriptional regulator C-terminal domain-containing protein n=1 Tax=Nisaea sp. TaxID=2024842 RepID=UPI0032EDDF9D
MATPNGGRTRIQQENRERILTAALDMFSRSGYRGTTLDQIAAAAGMSKPNLLYYFRTKQELYQTVLQETLDDWLTPFAKLDPQGDPASELGAYISAKLAHARINPKASRLFANEILQGAPLLEDTLKGPLKDLVETKSKAIRTWIADGKMVPVDPLHLIYMIWAATQHYADFETQMDALEGTDSDTRAKRFEAAERTLFTVLFNGLKPR